MIHSFIHKVYSIGGNPRGFQPMRKFFLRPTCLGCSSGWVVSPIYIYITIPGFQRCWSWSSLWFLSFFLAEVLSSTTVVHSLVLLFYFWDEVFHPIVFMYFYLFSLLKKLVRDFVYLFWLKWMKVPLWVFISFMRVFPHYIRSHLVVISLVYYWFDCIIVVVEVEQIELVQVKNYALCPMHVHIPKINSISPTPIMLNFLSFKPLTYLMILHWSMT